MADEVFERDANHCPVMGAYDGTDVKMLRCDSNGTLSMGASVTSTAATQKTVAVDTSADLIIAANSTRKGFIVCNNGSTDCYLGLTASVVSGAAAAANGGVLLQQGNKIAMDRFGGWTGAIYAITAAGSTVVSVLEW